MNFPEPYRDELETMPELLQALISQELAAGNEIDSISHGFPAPPIGACVQMKGAITTHPMQDGGGFKYCWWPNWNRSNGLTDERGHFLVLNPPGVEPAPPGMTEIPVTLQPVVEPVSLPHMPSGSPSPSSPQARFEASMAMNFETWHEGLGYDLTALREASPDEKAAIETMLLHCQSLDWRDIQALAELDTESARLALRKIRDGSDAELRLAVMRFAPHLMTQSSRAEALIDALQTAVIYGGLTQALDQVEKYHPPEVVDALFRGLLNRPGEVAMHYAAMLFYLHGKADEQFDWNQRPFFLRFHTTDNAERQAAFRELCQQLGVKSALLD